MPAELDSFASPQISHTSAVFVDIPLVLKSPQRLRQTWRAIRISLSLSQFQCLSRYAGRTSLQRQIRQGLYTNFAGTEHRPDADSNLLAGWRIKSVFYVPVLRQCESCLDVLAG